MPIVTNNQFQSWLESAVYRELSSDASRLMITYAGRTNSLSFVDFDHNSI